ncbi:MAG: transcription antitermination factor NusB [Candidatus Caldatribacterium sp.]|uniref:transcription antitermination factor NusB n=1 Tax=Candidatus Caldatribacterium sp. TaxID=2282143 RepID=UPI002990DED6|nr:transcription antitermination factor NusB [Candidatus Caldatribacterium sp.]MCX7730782.1 transcription antitermination factor NusB [Candidatus Caldatribacterium sp.]MDW8080781.1 transcription antitermination factor NusB [Candidatus Calescibacterium sp.]
MRRKARELALQVLFERDLRRKRVDDVLSHVSLPSSWDEDTQNFFLTLVRGVEEKEREIDKLITEVTEGWPLQRMAAIDRNILRMAAYEILFIPEIPPSVSINEAVELGKKYGTEESGKFINGVLGRLVRHLEEQKLGGVKGNGH